MTVIMNQVQIFAAIVALVVGVLVIWANPSRRQNLALFLFAIQVSAWLCFRWLAVGANNSVDGLRWLRFTTGTGALIPFFLWHVFDSIRFPQDRFRPIFFRALPILLFFLILAIIPFTEWFIPTDSSPQDRRVPAGYFVHFGGLLVGYVWLMIATLVASRRRTGIERVELNVVLLGAAFSWLIVIALMFARRFWDVDVPKNLTVFIVIGMFVYWAVSITTHRIFDARHLFLIVTQRVLLLAFVCCASYAVWAALSPVFSQSLTLICTVAIMLWLSSWLGQRIDVWLVRYPRAIQARSAAFNAAQSEIGTDELRSQFLSILNGWGMTDRSIILMGDGSVVEGDGIKLTDVDAVIGALSDLEWVTPERLVRERETPSRRCLSAFLRQHQLGAMVLRRSPTLLVIVGVGVRPSRRPFTFPEVTQLRELTSIFESALSRTQLLLKAQRAEQLATVGLLGAGVAHEIRNPLVSIKTFAQLLPKHFDDPKFRERFSKLIVEEVARIDRLTEQLLDLAAPHDYKKSEVALHEVIQSSVELVSARSGETEIDLTLDLQATPDVVISDTNGLKQVILNLCFNAIQAQDGNPPGRPVWVRLETRRVSDVIELTVHDNGPGITEDSRSHLFEVFHSTKSTGFGLGLTVCGEILSSLDSTIALDPYDPSHGAVFRIKLPCPPHS